MARLLVRRLSWFALMLPILGALPAHIAAAAQPDTDITVTHDVPYTTVDGVTLTLDVYQPVDEATHPALLLIHGGGWDHGDKSGDAEVGEALARAGFIGFAVNYRLSPPGGTWHYPAPIDDVQTALRWVRSHATDYRVDATRVGAYGESAGAYLALMLGVTGKSGVDRADAVVSWSGPTDFTTQYDYNESFANYLGCTLTDCPDRWTGSSPITNVTSDAAPVFLANSLNEIIDVGQATTYAEVLARAGVPSDVVLLPGNLHAKQYFADAIAPTIAFLETYLAGSE